MHMYVCNVSVNIYLGIYDVCMYVPCVIMYTGMYL